MSAIPIDTWAFTDRELIADALDAVNPDDDEARSRAGVLADRFRVTDAERKAAEWATTVKPGHELRCPYCEAGFDSLRLYNEGCESAACVGYDVEDEDRTRVVFEIQSGSEFETTGTLTCVECGGDMPLPAWMEVDYV